MPTNVAKKKRAQSVPGRGSITYKPTVIKVDNKTLTKRAQSVAGRGSITYKPTAKNLAEAVRFTPGVRKNVTPITILNLPGDLMREIDPNGKVYRALASKPNLTHVPKRFPSKRGRFRLTGNQAARRIERGARSIINQGLANRVDNLLLLSRKSGAVRTASPLQHHQISDYVRANPAPTNRNIGAAVNIRNSLIRGYPWYYDRQRDRQRLENRIAREIESYRPFVAPRSPPQRSSRRARPSRNGSLNSLSSLNSLTSSNSFPNYYYNNFVIN